MKKKNLLYGLGLTAIMTFMLATAGFLPSVARAHVGDASISCENVMFNYSSFANANNVVSEQISIDGSNVYSGSFSFTGTSGSHTVGINPGSGNHSVAASASWNTNGHQGSFQSAAEVECGGETTTTTTTTTTEPPTTTTTVPPPPCNGHQPNPLGGKDGNPGNDDCAPDVPTTSTTPTTPTTPPVTTTVPPNTTPTPVPTTPVPTTPQVIPPVEVVKPDKAPVTKEKLDKALAKQAPPAKVSAAEAIQSPKELPNTGLPLGAVVALGVGLVGTGIKLRRVNK